MAWIFYCYPIVALLHVLEEYAYPGGFPAFMRRMARPVGHYITPQFAFVFNALFILLSCIGAIVGDDIPVVSLSIANLFLINGLIHLISSIRAGSYTPGMITALLLFFPLAGLSYYVLLTTSFISFREIVIAALLGVTYQIAPFMYLGIRLFVAQFNRR
jgi:hypothetical protein